MCSIAYFRKRQVSGMQSKNGQFPTTGLRVFMYHSCTTVTAALCIKMRALPADTSHQGGFDEQSYCTVRPHLSCHIKWPY
jgi:hypothetical protein